MPILSHDPGYLRPQIDLTQSVSESLTFRGFNFIAADTQPGSPMTVDVYWRSDHEEGNSPAYADAPLTLSLVNEEGAFAVWTGELAPDSDWDPRQEICRRVRTRIPPDIPPGPYLLKAELSAGDEAAAHSITLRDVDIAPSTRLFEAPPLVQRADAILTDADTGDEIRLLGVVMTKVITDTNTLDVTLAWKAGASLKGNYKAFVHLVDAAGNIATQSDSVPGPDYPTNRWIEGEVVLDRHAMSLPPSGPPGGVSDSCRYV